MNCERCKKDGLQSCHCEKGMSGAFFWGFMALYSAIGLLLLWLVKAFEKFII
jgi:hypothetical protein